MSDQITKGGTTITRSGGTAQQWQWVQDAVNNCGYDLGLLNANVTVQWVDPLPVSSDIGHAHSYMVTAGAAPNFTISIATWADNPGNPNNSGLPDPVADIYDFYQQSFVHELGHVDHFTTITSDTERTDAAALFWMPDSSGGASNRRYGTLADWDVTVWADNIKEAIAETFKVVYYKGRLIYGNRTQWHIDAKDWNNLWAKLTPPVAARYKVNPTPSADGTYEVPSQFGIAYLQQASALWAVGPWEVIGVINPSAGGAAATADLVMRDQYGDWSAELSVDSHVFQPFFGAGFVEGGETWFASPNVHWGDSAPGLGSTLLEITAESDPGSSIPAVIITISVQGSVVSQYVQGVHSDSILTAHGVTSYNDAGDLPWVVEFGTIEWGVASDIGPPPYPYLNSVGDMSVGQGLRGAVRLG